MADYTFKILFVGDSYVGKSSILLRYTEGDFDEHHAATVGVDFRTRQLTVGDNKRVKLLIWDTAGEERFRTLTASYYRGAQAVVFVFDCARRSTFESIMYWLQEAEKNCTIDNPVKLLIANKIDLQTSREVTTREAQNFAMRHSLLLVETSAKTNEGVERAFDELVHKILDDPVLTASSRGAALGHRIVSAAPVADSGTRCCGLL